MAMRRCHRCNAEWISEKRAPGVKETCRACDAYLHACANCRHHDPKVHNQCRIPNTEWVGDRAGANFCDEFDFRVAGNSPAKDRDSSARDAFGALFGDSPPETDVRGFDDLFKS
jgi:hypothetical protein